MEQSFSYYDEEMDATVGVFNGFLRANEFKKTANNLHKLRLENKTNKQLNNIKEMKYLTNDIRQWLQEIWFAEAIETGLKYFAFVVPTSTFGRYSMTKTNEEAPSITGIEILYFDYENHAKEWLKSKQ